MSKITKGLTFLLILIIALFVGSGSVFADVHITNFSGTTKESTASHPKNYHHFYSSKDTINVKFKVDKFIKTHKKSVYMLKYKKATDFGGAQKPRSQ